MSHLEIEGNPTGSDVVSEDSEEEKLLEWLKKEKLFAAGIIKHMQCVTLNDLLILNEMELKLFSRNNFFFVTNVRPFAHT